MPFHVRDTATDTAVRTLARLKGKTLTDTIREAVEHEYAALTSAPPLIDRLRSVHAAFLSLKQQGGKPADKAFFDDLSGDL